MSFLSYEGRIIFYKIGDYGNIRPAITLFYELSGILDASMENGGEGRYYVEEGPSSGNLVITKTGDTYTVTIDPLEIIYSDPDSVGNGDWGSTTMQWNYAGKIKKGSHGVEWRKQVRRQRAGIKLAGIPAEVIYLPR